ncbi:MAG: M48 family metallopeptidase [Bacteroidales bacterium]
MKKISLLFIVLLLLSACSKVPVTGRKQMNLLPSSMMLSMSLTNYKEILNESKVLSDQNPKSKNVRNVGNKISDAVTAFMKEEGDKDRIKNFEWEYNVIDKDVINAWCMPGGKIAVYTGILPVTQNDGGLATVLAHEIAHAVAKHGNERMSQQLAVALGGVSLEVAMKEKPEKTKNIFRSVYGVGSTLGTLAYSRKHEYEADKLGMVFMAKAGYAPDKSIEFWKRMKAQKDGASVPQFLSTHPTDNNRIEAMKEFLPEARKYYSKN